MRPDIRNLWSDWNRSRRIAARRRLRSYCVRGLSTTALAAASLTLAVCDRIVDPPLPDDAEQFSPPAVYTTWWEMTQACSGVTGSLHAVTWYKTTQQLRDPRTGDALVGYWSAASNRIVLRTSVMFSGGTVRHEMLHSLLHGGSHSRQQFLGNCLGVVACEASCILDAGPYPTPPESPIQARNESIDITTHVEPRSPTTDHDGGFFSITVLVRNRSTHWAAVLPFLPGPDIRHTFSLHVHGSAGQFNGEDIALDSSAAVFAPGETKRQVLDFRIGDGLPPGVYTVRGGYAGYWSGDSSLVIGQ